MTHFGNPLHADESRLARAYAMGGVPAFVRRARRLEVAVEALHREIAVEWNRRLARLLPLVDGLEMRPDVQSIVETLSRHPAFSTRAQRRPRARAGLAPRLRRAAEALNREWRGYLETIFLERIHGLQRDFNRYYPIERESALRGVPLRPFKPVPLLDRAELFTRHPPLPI